MKKPILISLVVITLLGIGAYLYFFTFQTFSGFQAQPINADEPQAVAEAPAQSVEATSTVSFEEKGNSLDLFVNQQKVQTITISDKTLTNFLADVSNSNAQKFITNLDVNFDGYPDVGVVTGVGYGGVNYFYDFYVYNPALQRWERDFELTQISNPMIATSTKSLFSSYRSGPEWYKDEYKYYGNESYTFVADSKNPEGTRDASISGKWKHGVASNPSLNGTTPSWEYTFFVPQKFDVDSTFNIDGYQTMVRMSVHLVKTNSGYNIVFNSYGEGNLYDYGLKSGDVIATISPTDNSALIKVKFLKTSFFPDDTIKELYFGRTQ